MMDKFAIFFLTSFVACAAVTPLFGRVSLSLGIIDHPSKKKFHLTSMPLLGGAAIAATFVAVIIFMKFRLGAGLIKQDVFLLAAAILMFFTGLIDDIRTRGIKPRTKLALQALAAMIMIAGGIRLPAADGYSIDPRLALAIDSVLTIIWVAGISNALNLLDNIDGLSSGTAAICSCFFALFALLIGRQDVAVMAVIFSGCCMGFLFHNFHPASLFLGDAGSMFLGTMLAGFGMMVTNKSDAVSALSIGVILGLLIFDTGLVTIMRVTHGLHITQGGKDHTSHRLCNMGMSVQGAVTTLFASSFLFGICGIAMLKVERTTALLIPLILFLICATMWYLLKDTYNYNKGTV